MAIYAHTHTHTHRADSQTTQREVFSLVFVYDWHESFSSAAAVSLSWPASDEIPAYLQSVRVYFQDGKCLNLYNTKRRITELY